MATEVKVHCQDVESPPMKPDSGCQFSEKTIRLAFIRKVYGILCTQLLLTFSIVTPFVVHDGLRSWSKANPWLCVASSVTTLIMVMVFVCYIEIGRKSPQNRICLGIFTIAEGVSVGSTCSRYSADSVLLTVGSTAIICLALTLFAFQTKIDFTTKGTVLYICLIVFVLFGIVMIFLPRSKFPILHVAFAGVGTLLFSFYLIYDTQLMLGGKHKNAISPEEYIFAALNLYVDIMNIFRYLLKIFVYRT